MNERLLLGILLALHLTASGSGAEKSHESPQRSGGGHYRSTQETIDSETAKAYARSLRDAFGLLEDGTYQSSGMTLPYFPIFKLGSKSCSFELKSSGNRISLHIDRGSALHDPKFDVTLPESPEWKLNRLGSKKTGPSKLTLAGEFLKKDAWGIGKVLQLTVVDGQLKRAKLVRIQGPFQTTLIDCPF